MAIEGASFGSARWRRRGELAMTPKNSLSPYCASSTSGGEVPRHGEERGAARCSPMREQPRRRGTSASRSAARRDCQKAGRETATPPGRSPRSRAFSRGRTPRTRRWSCAARSGLPAFPSAYSSARSMNLSICASVFASTSPPRYELVAVRADDGEARLVDEPRLVLRREPVELHLGRGRDLVLRELGRRRQLPDVEAAGDLAAEDRRRCSSRTTRGRRARGRVPLIGPRS